MMIDLIRVAISSYGAFGVLTRASQPIAVTLERTFEENRILIGEGSHRCTRSIFHKGNYPTFEIEVAGHSRVLFHKGNTEIDSEGCVLVGQRFGTYKRNPAVLSSAAGFENFMAATEDLESFVLRVSRAAVTL